MREKYVERVITGTYISDTVILLTWSSEMQHRREEHDHPNEVSNVSNIKEKNRVYRSRESIVARIGKIVGEVPGADAEEQFSTARCNTFNSALVAR